MKQHRGKNGMANNVTSGKNETGGKHETAK